MQKLKEFITSRPILQEMLKEAPGEEGKFYHSEIWIYTKEYGVPEMPTT